MSQHEKQLSIIRMPELVRITGLSKVGIYRLMKEDSTFPRQVDLGKRAVGWFQHEVNEWLLSRKRV